MNEVTCSCNEDLIQRLFEPQSADAIVNTAIILVRGEDVSLQIHNLNRLLTVKLAYLLQQEQKQLNTMGSFRMNGNKYGPLKYSKA